MTDEPREIVEVIFTPDEPPRIEVHRRFGELTDPRDIADPEHWGHSDIWKEDRT